MAYGMGYDDKFESMQRLKEDKADSDFTEWLESLTDAEVDTRHFLLDRKGVKAALHWFDFPHGPEYNDLSGRLDPETGTFHYMRDDGTYSRVFPEAIKRATAVRYVLFGGSGVVGEIRLVEEGKQEKERCPHLAGDLCVKEGACECYGG